MLERADLIRRDSERDAAETKSPERRPPDTKKDQQRAAEPTALVAPVADVIAQAKLSVGPAGDAYEREADAVATRVVRALRVTEVSAPAEASDAGPRLQRRELDSGGDGSGDGSDADGGDGESIDVGGRLRRVQRAAATPAVAASSITRIQRAATVGLAGGELDDDTARMLAASRSGGRPLPDPARSKMESAFGADFSGVRVHSGPASTELNDRIQAKAFTTGSDIYFRESVPDASTSSGQELLAHELTHTIQQGAAGVNRSVLMRRWWPFGKKKGAGKPVIGAPSGVSLNGGDMMTELAKQGFHPVPIANPQITADAPPPPAAATPYSGMASKKPSNAKSEVGKPVAAVTVAGGSAAAGGFGAAGSGGAAAGGAVADTAAAGGAGAGALGVLTAADAAMGLNNARKMNNEAEQFGDAAMSKQAGKKAKDNATTLGIGATNTARGGVTIANVLEGTAHVAEGAAPAALGVAAGSLGVVAGGAMVLQGSWRGGKAVMKLCRLTYGRGQKMLSAEGERWKAAFVSAEKFKAAINALKIVAGGLGIAAGALVIVGSPVGWALGLAAAIAGGVYAVSKIAAKTSNAREKSKARHEDRSKAEVSAPTHADTVGEYGRSYIDLSEKGYDLSKVKQAGPQNARDQGEGFGGQEGEMREGEAERTAAIEEANRLAALASKNARTAAEIREAMGHGDQEFVMAALDAAAANPDADIAEMILALDDQRLHDAFQVLSAVNIDPDEALAASGQLLIEQKLSKAEAM